MLMQPKTNSTAMRTSNGSWQNSESGQATSTAADSSFYEAPDSLYIQVTPPEEVVQALQHDNEELAA